MNDNIYYLNLENISEKGTVQNPIYVSFNVSLSPKTVLTKLKRSLESLLFKVYNFNTGALVASFSFPGGTSGIYSILGLIEGATYVVALTEVNNNFPCNVSRDCSDGLYYGDPFGVGMQYPNVELKDNVLTVTSSDAVYDENYNATYVTNPISDLTVYWDCNGSVTTYTTNEQGQVTIDAKLLTKGKHNVAVSKVSESGIPLVLRLPKDYTVEVTTTIGESTTVGDSEPTGVRGDINYDGKVTTVDLLLLKKYLLGIVKW